MVGEGCFGMYLLQAQSLIAKKGRVKGNHPGHMAPSQMPSIGKPNHAGEPINAVYPHSQACRSFNP
jgi:hypothetical protein